MRLSTFLSRSVTGLGLTAAVCTGACGEQRAPAGGDVTATSPAADARATDPARSSPGRTDDVPGAEANSEPAAADHASNDGAPSDAQATPDSATAQTQSGTGTGESSTAEASARDAGVAAVGSVTSGQAPAGASDAATASTPPAASLCPAGPFEDPVPAGAVPTRVEGLPPQDAFNEQGQTRTNVEGPVWIGDKLYVSEFPFLPAPQSRILALDPVAGTVSVALAIAGANGLAVDTDGALIATDHLQGAIVRMAFPLNTPEILTDSYEGHRFNSPNDLAVRSDGTVYFSDPDYQAPSDRPQPKTRVYRLAPGDREPISFDDARAEPNGVTLSADERTLYVAGADGIFAYPVLADGAITAGSGARLNGFGGGADGLGMDCAGHLYAASGQRVAVLAPDGTELTSIAVPQAESVTNVAFGGMDRKTLFITAMGSGEQRGVFRVELHVPGMPY